MTTGGARRQSFDCVRASVALRLADRRAEIEESILTRARSVPSETGSEDAEYLEGLRDAVGAAVAYGLAGIERGEDRAGPVPAAVIAQARSAAQHRIGLDTVLRRYVAGYAALGDYLIQAISNPGSPTDGTVVSRLQKELTAILDRLVATVTSEYRCESERASVLPRQRLMDRIRRLLVGELVDTGGIDYDFDAWHLAVIGKGPDADEVVSAMASELDRRLLLVGAGEHVVWGWLGARRPVEVEDLTVIRAIKMPPGVSLSIGEPAKQLPGWRLTYRQAQAASSIAPSHAAPVTCYADVALLATVLRDEDLTGLLITTYLTPLARERDGGNALRETLRAYLACDRNASSTAAMLRVARQTVATRIHTIEELIGKPLNQCAVELELTLQLEERSALSDR
jgi:hypothetical protein